MLARIVLVLIDSEDDGQIRSLRGGRDDHFLRPRGDVLRRAVAAGEDTGRLEYDINPERFPGQLRRILDRQDLEFILVDGDLVSAGGDARLEVAENGVVFE